MWNNYPLPTALLVVLGMLLFAWAVYDGFRQAALLP